VNTARVPFVTWSAVTSCVVHAESGQDVVGGTAGGLEAVQVWVCRQIRWAELWRQ
jgi:hypothetical protein